MDVTNLIKVSKRKRMKFNMLLNYCIGKAAVSINALTPMLNPDNAEVVPAAFVKLGGAV